LQKISVLKDSSPSSEVEEARNNKINPVFHEACLFACAAAVELEIKVEWV